MRHCVSIGYPLSMDKLTKTLCISISLLGISMKFKFNEQTYHDMSTPTMAFYLNIELLDHAGFYLH